MYKKVQVIEFIHFLYVGTFSLDNVLIEVHDDLFNADMSSNIIMGNGLAWQSLF